MGVAFFPFPMWRDGRLCGMRGVFAWQRLWKLCVCLLVSMLGACAVTPPHHPENVCEIFDEKPDWHKPARRAAEEYGTSIPVMMSMMYQESGFRAEARPPFRWWFIIPLGRPSTAYGYAQAKDDTWAWYTSSSSRYFASRNDFADAITFMGWYNAYSYRRNRIRNNDAYHLYLAYHEGHGGFDRKSFDARPWLKDVARTVSNRAARYDRQYAGCRKRLEDSEKGWLW